MSFEVTCLPHGPSGKWLCEAVKQPSNFGDICICAKRSINQPHEVYLFIFYFFNPLAIGNSKEAMSERLGKGVNTAAVDIMGIRLHLPFLLCLQNLHKSCDVMFISFKDEISLCMPNFIYTFISSLSESTDSGCLQV